MTTQDNSNSHHEGQLSLWDAVSIIVGIVVGVSIFRAPQTIFANTSDPWAALVVWGFGGLLAIVGALCFAELVTTYPRSGGAYEYLTRGYGRSTGFMFGWAQMALITPANVGAMAYVFADYGRLLFDASERFHLAIPCDFLYASLAVIILTAINVMGVTFGKTTQNLLTIAKVLGILGILIAGIVWAQPDKWMPNPAPESFGFEPLAIILVLYAYGGWNDSAFVAAEVKNPKRNMPLALVLGTAAILGIYLLINTAYMLGLGFDGAKAGRELPVLLMERTPMGHAGGIFIGLLVMISALGAANAMIFTSPRVYATVGMDHRIFGFMGHWRPGAGTPVAALLLQGALTLMLVFLLGTRAGNDIINAIMQTLHLGSGREWTPESGFDTLVSHTSPVFWIFFLLTGISIFILRWKDRERERPFSVPLYPILPLVFCGMCAYMLYASIEYVRWRALLGIGVLALAIPLYLLSQRMKQR